MMVDDYGDHHYSIIKNGLSVMVNHEWLILRHDCQWLTILTTITETINQPWLLKQIFTITKNDYSYYDSHQPWLAMIISIIQNIVDHDDGYNH